MYALGETMAKKSSKEPVPPQPVEQHLSSEDASAHEDMNEDLPSTAPPAQGLPPIKRREVEEDEKIKKSKKKDGMDKAVDMIDDYYKDTPKRDPSYDHGGED
jgi:hypothetical protein